MKCRWLVAGPLDFGDFKCGSNRRNDLLGDFILQLEHICHCAIKLVSPKVSAVGGVDQLPRDAHSSASLSDAALENVSNTELATYLLYVDCRSLIGERRIPGDDQQRFEV